MTKSTFDKLCKDNNVQCLPLWTNEGTQSVNSFVIYGMYSDTAFRVMAEKFEGEILIFRNDGDNMVTLNNGASLSNEVDIKAFLFKGILVTIDE